MIKDRERREIGLDYHREKHSNQRDDKPTLVLIQKVNQNGPQESHFKHNASIKAASTTFGILQRVLLPSLSSTFHDARRPLS